jgi:excisionase family DNA binding protein
VVPADGGSRLLSVREVAEHLTVSTATVYALIDRSEIPHVRVSNAVRVRLQDLEVFIGRASAGSGHVPGA